MATSRREIAARYTGPTVASKTCPKCKTLKPRGEFNLNKSRYDGLSSHCKLCRSAMDTPEKRAKRRKPFIYSDTQRNCHYRRAYGITLAEYDLMLVEQGGVCAICGRPPKEGKRTTRLAVDHDHTSGRVRKLLCTGCNLMIALFERKPFMFQNIKAYLPD